MTRRNTLNSIVCSLLLAAGGACFSGAASASNNNPVVLVHGWIGWGRHEMLGYKYWGGINGDLQEQLKARYTDQQVYTAEVGPVSSVWDRASELFYQIKGGCVDYGAAHAAEHGHNRYGRCFPGLYPQWDASHPVHLITHSMGGQTARALAQLLADNGTSSNPGLFSYPVSAQWVKSVTAVSTPNDGTTLSDIVVDYIPFAQALFGVAATALGTSPAASSFVYDFKLDQWWLAPRQPGESLDSYLNRVKQSPVFTDLNKKDISRYDLAPKGAADLNAWVKDQPNIYYFSYATKSTYSGFLTGWQYPILSSNPLIALFSGPLFMGNYTRHETGYPVIDSSWWANDGIVVTRSMKAPTIMSCGAGFCRTPSVIRDISKGAAPVAGQWNYKGLMDGFDHLDIVGHQKIWDITGFYKAHIDQLRGL